MIRMGTIEPIHPESYPARSSLEKTNAQTWELIQYAVINHSGECNDERQRMAETVNRHESFKRVEAHAVMTTAVDRKHASQPFSLCINRPIGFVSQIQRQPARREHSADHAQVFDSA